MFVRHHHPPTNSYAENLMLSVRVLGGSALVNGICALITEAKKASCPFCHVRLQLEGAIYVPRSIRPSPDLTPDTESAGGISRTSQPPELREISVRYSSRSRQRQKPHWKQAWHSACAHRPTALEGEATALTAKRSITHSGGFKATQDSTASHHHVHSSKDRKETEWL